MGKNPWKKAERVIGSAYVLIALLAFFNAWWYGKPGDMLWLCYWAALLLGIGFLARSRTLVWSQLFLLFIPDVLWSADALMFAVRGSSVLGITDYFFALPTLSQQFVSLIHPLTVLSGIYTLTCWKGEKKKTLCIAGVIAVMESVAAFALARLLTTAEQNVNCVYRFCGNVEVGGVYEAWWFVTMAAIVAITYGLARWCTTENKRAQSHLSAA